MEPTSLRDAAEYAIWEVSKSLADAACALQRFELSLSADHEATHQTPTAVNQHSPDGASSRPALHFGLVVSACAWCGCLLGMTPTAGKTVISHGICKACSGKLKGEI